MTLWGQYVFRRGAEIEDMWDQMFRQRRDNSHPVRLLYVCGRGFDVRALAVMERFVDSLRESGCVIQKAELLLVGFSGYQLSDELHALTQKNADELERIFRTVGPTKIVTIGTSVDGEDDISTSNV